VANVHGAIRGRCPFPSGRRHASARRPTRASRGPSVQWRGPTEPRCGRRGGRRLGAASGAHRVERKEHWESVYRTTGATGVSWYQPRADVSLELIRRLAPDPATPIIDVGAGASTLVGDLLDAGYQALTALDLAASALALEQQRLGRAAQCV